MEIKLIEKTNEKLVLELSDTNETEVNTLRRLIVSEVPTMAIQEVEFIKNDSALFDEILANRLGLVPLVTDLSVYSEVDPKKKGKVLNQVEFKLKVKGPCTVYSKDLHCTDDKIKPVFDNIPIVKLLDNQELELHATAVLGRGKKHMKFAPGVVYYYNKPKLKINNDLKKIEQFKDKFPEGAFKDGKLDEESLLKNNLYEACEGVCEELLSVGYEEDIFIFKLESFGQLEPVEIIVVALEKFNEKLEEFDKLLKGSKDQPIKNVANMAKKLTLKR